METPCVYIFDGPRKHVDLLEQLLDVSNNPAIASNQRQRGRGLRAMTATKSQGSETCVTKGRKL